MYFTGTVMVIASLVGGVSGAVYAFGGKSQQMVLGRMVAAREDAVSVPTTSSARNQFVLSCSGCHGSNGSGSLAGQVPDLRRMGSFLKVPGGREFLIKVPGVMASGLDDTQVADVTNWLLTTLAKDSVTTAPSPYTAGEVARARAAPLIDVGAERNHLLQHPAGAALLSD